MEPCQECFKDRVSFYCCCSQIRLCKDCVLSHIDHVVLDKTSSIGSQESDERLMKFLIILKEIKNIENEMKGEGVDELIRVINNMNRVEESLIRSFDNAK